MSPLLNPGQDHRTFRIVNVLQSLAMGGMEKGALASALAARDAGFEVSLLLYDQPYGGTTLEYDAQGLPVTFRRRRPGWDWRFPVGLAWEFARGNFDVIHARNNTALIYSAAALKLMGRHRPKLITTFHTYPNGGNRVRVATRWAARQADALTAVSGELAERVVADGWADRCRTIWNGVDLETFRPDLKPEAVREQLGLGPKTFLIGQIARFDANKRQADLLMAFRVLRTEVPDAALLFAGDGPTREAVQSQRATGEVVFFLGFVERVPELLCALDVFVLCSDHEGAPRALLEAMACGCTVIATSVGGIPEILDTTNGPAGLLIPPRRPDMLARALQSLATSSELRRHYKMLARKRVIEAFSAEREWQEQMALYREIAGK